MAPLRLSLSIWDYDRVKALEDGRVRPEGIELIFLNHRVEETYPTLETQSRQTKPAVSSAKHGTKNSTFQNFHSHRTF